MKERDRSEDKKMSLLQSVVVFLFGSLFILDHGYREMSLAFKSVMEGKMHRAEKWMEE